MQDLRSYLPQLQHYKQTSTSILEWIEATRKKQVALQATKIENVQALEDLINNQKVICWTFAIIRATSNNFLWKHQIPDICTLWVSLGSECRNQGEEGDSR